MHYLGLEVPANIISAATGGDECAAAGKSGGSDEIALGNGWTVRKSGGSVVAEHKAGTDTTTETDVTIKWPDGFRVWVSDGDGKSCNDVQNILPDEGEYRNYNLHLIVNGSDCYSNYGMADKTELSRALKSAKLPITFGLTCAGATAVCYAVVPGAQVKALISSPKSLAGCVLGSMFTLVPGFTLSITGGDIATSRGYALGLLGASFVAGTAGLAKEGLRIGAIRAGYSAMENLKPPSSFDEIAGQLGGSTVITSMRGEALIAPETTSMYAGLLSGVKSTMVQNTESLTEELASNDDLRNQFAKNLDDLAKIAKAAGDDDTAKILEEAAEEIVKAEYVGEITEIISRIDEKISPQKIENLFKALNEKVESFKKNPAQICSTVGMLTATTVTSLEAMAMVGDVDQLNVKIHPPSNVANIAVSSPWMRDKTVEVK